MEDILFFVEGIADVTFIQQYVRFAFNIELNINQIIYVEGWNNLINQTKQGEAYQNKMNANTFNGGKNLVVFDADANFAQRETEILAWRAKYKLDFELFLFPNNSDTGALEDLLERVINPVNEPIFDCWERYETCINSKSIVGRATPLTIPAKKTKIYGYLETLLGSSHSEKEKIKERNRNYLDSNHWDLGSNNLTPLKNFLSNFIQPQTL
jgi:hypothetical protein